MDKIKVLVVDDDKNILQTLTSGLESLDCEVRQCVSAEQALTVLEVDSFDLVLTDVRLGGKSGVELIHIAKGRTPQTIYVAMTAFASFENAVAAIKEGAFDYLAKPFSVAQLEHLLTKIRTVLDLRRENDSLKSVRSRPEYFAGYISPAMRRLEEVARKVAPTDATVLIVGESGTGKSEFARLLHSRSTRASQPFVEVNCASLADTLLESELFGHVKGAFTGAVYDKKGKLELAEGGTVFLDEVGELSPTGQAKLLRFLQEKIVERVGATSPIAIDARVVAATNRKLDENVASGTFREDLFYRLNVFECAMVPLRHRREDIPVLLSQLLIELTNKSGLLHSPHLPPDVLALLLEYNWPGNIRELRNVLERLIILSHGRRIELEDLPEVIKSRKQASIANSNDVSTLKELEREHIKKILELEKNQERAAKILGTTVVTLWRKRKEYGLE